MKISKNLPNEKRYVLLHKLKKKPIKADWNIKPISKQQAQQTLNDNYNVGFLLGKGLLCIDCDSLEMQEAVESLIKTKTYTQKSARKGFNQYIFKIDFKQESLSLSFNDREMGDILADTKTGKGKQVVLAPSKYKITAEDIKKCSEFELKLGEIKKYEVINDISVAKLTKKELSELIFQFESKKTKQATKEIKEFQNKSSIDDLSITSVLSTAGMEQDNKGQYFGSNPFHGSTGGHNFYINPQKNLAYCFRSGCDVALSPAKCIALQEGIIKNCDDDLRGSDFIKVLDIAKEKYGVVDEHLVSETTENKIEKKDLNFMTIQDLKNYKHKPKYIIQDLLEENEITMAYGQTGGLKSMDSMYRAICIAGGKKVYGKYKAKPCPVAILSAEDSIKTNKERVMKIMKGLKLRKKIPLYILPRSDCDNILSMGFKESIFDFCKLKGIKVLVMDTINPLTPDIDDNKAKDVTQVFNKFLKPLSDECNVAPVFLHHTTKAGNSFLGSTKWKANSENVYRFERKKISSKYQINHEKNKSGEAEVLKLEINFGEKEINFKLLGTSKASLFKTEKGMTQIEYFNLKLDELIENKDTSRKEIYETLTKAGVKFKLDKNKKNSNLDRTITDWRKEK